MQENNAGLKIMRPEFPVQPERGPDAGAGGGDVGRGVLRRGGLPRAPGPGLHDVQRHRILKFFLGREKGSLL